MNRTLSALALAAMLLGSSAAFAADYTLPETVGATDKTAGWWSAFSQYFSIGKGEAITLQYTNYVGTNNYNSGTIVLTNDADRSATGYTEHLVIRSDNWGWGPLYNNSVRTSNFNWDNFLADLDGANVTTKISYSSDGYIDITTTYTGTSTGTAYTYTYSTQEAVSDATIRAFLTVDGSYLTITSASTSTADTHVQEALSSHDGAYTVGSTSSTWWTDFSDDYTLQAGQQLDIEFVNTNGGKTVNYQNFLVVASTPYHRTRAGYSEYFIARADNYGWAIGWSSNDEGSKLTLTNDFDWTNFTSLIDGATVKLSVKFSAAKRISFIADIAGADGNNYTYTGVYTGEVTDDAINVFLPTDGAQLSIKSAAVSNIGAVTALPNASKAAQVASVTYYDLAGKVVSAQKRGVVIKVTTYADGSRKATRIVNRK